MTIRAGNVARDTNTIVMSPLAMCVLRDGTGDRKQAGKIVDCLRAKPKNTDAEATSMRVGHITTIRMIVGR